MPFRAVRIDKTEQGQAVGFVTMTDAELMDGDTLVDVSHSAVNYKDGLALSGKSPIPRRFPMGAGIDFAGAVAETTHPGLKKGDRVVLNGHGASETHFGGYARRARVPGAWLVP
ncbi:MAG: alcohol dehydrogenase catalytic domain-containing protein, partial [Hyphomicrobiales bacterium]|nr:alcohol dehydrogenase catalytic domain-containing protein [Hyphomicrobiales bacterium]